MFRPRVIPILLLKTKGLVKSVRFRDYRYIGDPINAVKIFNDQKADELAFLDITASKEKRSISLDFVKNVGEEANMPFSVGGGISTLKQIQAIIAAGAEKVIINTNAIHRPGFIKEASDSFGSSTIAVCMDVKKNWIGKEKVWAVNGSKASVYDPVEFALLMEYYGAGELIVQSIQNDGMMEGYDLNLISRVSMAVTIPVIAAGGAGKLNHLKFAIEEGRASAVAAGSMFVYHGPRRGILITYPESKELFNLFNNKKI
jgi:cyclase